MTKAEAYVRNSDLWEYKGQRREDHGYSADTIANIYERIDGSYRLVCYSCHGDSNLWKKVRAGEWGFQGQIEHSYDIALKDLV
jgi:hypothetical protein